MNSPTKNTRALEQPEEIGIAKTQSIDAPELDQSGNAPQHYPLSDGLHQELSEAPEPAKTTNYLFSHPDDIHFKEAASTNPVARIHRRVLFFACLLVGILAVSLGVGLGIGIPRSWPQPTSTQNITAPPLQLRTGALNDTSLSAVLSTDGNRHLFFQDINGTLRHAVYLQSYSNWSELVGVISTDRQPRPHTPLSAIQANLDVSGTDSIYFNIYYIDLDNRLAAIQYGAGSYNYTSATQLLNDSFLASPTGRSLSVTNISIHDDTPASNLSSNPTNGSVYLQSILLFYSGPNEEILCLHGNGFLVITSDQAGKTTANYTWTWQSVSLNITSNPNIKNAGDVSEYTLGSPFATIWYRTNLISYFIATDTKSSSHILQGAVYDLISSAEGTLYQDLPLPNSNVTLQNFTSPSLQLSSNSAWDFNSQDFSWSPADDSSPMPITDDLGFLVGAQFCAVVNNSIFSKSQGQTNKHFPFGRLAYIVDENTAFLYHQSNESLLLEEIQDIESGTSEFGKTNAVSIPTR